MSKTMTVLGPRNRSEVQAALEAKSCCGGKMQSLDADRHNHGEECGHTAIKHGDHYGFLVDGHLHCVVDPQKGDEIVCHVLPISDSNPGGCVPVQEEEANGWHETGHVHGPNCGHERVPHGDHFDYLVGNVLHHQHNGHCDNHGTITLLELRKVQKRPAPRPDARRSAEICEEEDADELTSLAARGRKKIIEKRRRHVQEDSSIAALLEKGTKSQRRFLMMLTMTGGYFLVELIFGLRLNSLALLSDSFHMLSDFVAIIIGFAAARLSTRMKTYKMSYGWQRAEVVGALANACFLVAVCFTIILEAGQKLAGFGHEDQDVLAQNSIMILIIGGVGLGINLVGLVIFGGE